MISQIIAAEHWRNREWVESAFNRLPYRFRPKIAARYAKAYAREVGGFRAANIGLFDAVAALGEGRVNLAGGEDELRGFAKARADECWRVAAQAKDADLCLQLMRSVALRYEIQPPSEANVTPKGQRARLLCEHWWRRAVRRYIARKVEAAAITLGLVHRRSEIYASNETCNRRRGQKIRNRAMLDAVLAVNDSGDEYTLQALSDLGVSNPKIRRMELMTRLAGFDAIAKMQGHAAEFYTLTAPSKYHARESAKGEENPKFNGATPRETQNYLCTVWQRIRAALHRRKIGMYGFRVCEPHHDGTPHWHMVLFMKPEHVEAVRATIKKYALAEDGGEAGAAKHRFTAKAIDRTKGSAAGYLAKYISKNIDGYGVGEDWEGGAGNDDATDNAKRVDAWASAWGIRQFQQIGGAPVSVWRELRRLQLEDAAGDLLLAKLIEAADSGDWAGYVNLQGGAMVRRVDLTARLWRNSAKDIETGEVKINKYGEVAADTVKGLSVWGVEVVTRLHTWVFKRGAVSAPSWSSVNNCTGDFKNEAGASKGVGGKGEENDKFGGGFCASEGNKGRFNGVGGVAGGLRQ